jgi:hypothetical protein
MFSTLRTRFGIPGVISVIALVFAMFGGAYAASNSSGGGKATASAKAKKGPRGPKGATGPAGPQGPAGAAGAKGDAGSNGSNGSNGSPGASGKSVLASAAAVPAECPTGTTGTKFEVEGSGVSSHVCSGKNGTNGQTGFTETLPEKMTETGLWGSGSQTPVGRHTFQISFPIPLAQAPADSDIVLVEPTENSKPGCPGRGGEALQPGKEIEPTIPEADPGKLCIYLDKMEETSPVSVGTSVKTPVYENGEWYAESGASPTGALLEVVCTASCQTFGTWAVTAPEE